MQYSYYLYIMCFMKSKIFIYHQAHDMRLLTLYLLIFFFFFLQLKDLKIRI